MKALITQAWANKNIIAPLRRKFKVNLVGSVAAPDGSSYHDADLVMLYHDGEEIAKFREMLQSMGWYKDDGLINDLCGNLSSDLWCLSVTSPKYGKCTICLDVFYQQFLSEGVLTNDNRYSSWQHQV